MPIAEFLDTFLSWGTIDKHDMPSTTDAFATLNAAIKAKSGKADSAQAESAERREARERDLYQPLADALNNPARCPGFVFKRTSERSDDSGGTVGSSKPDIILYAKEHLSAAELQAKKSRADMGFAASFIEVKRHVSGDPFQDPSEDVDRETWQLLLGKRGNGRELHNNTDTYRTLLQVLGQTVSYAVEICSRQHRTFCFSVLVCRCQARLIRMDRAGIIVSESFSLISHPEFLCRFAWCFSKLSNDGRGYDCTVQPATPTEETLFRDSVKAHICTQLLCTPDSEVMRKCLCTHYMPGFVTAVSLHPLPAGSTISKPRRLLVSRPICTPLSPSGRCTRAYWAVQADDDALAEGLAKVVFLKDTWRFAGAGAGRDHPDTVEPEGAILRYLHSRGVRNIPKVIDDGDVLKETQKTITQAYSSADWVSKAGNLKTGQIVARLHYRLLLDIAGFDLLQMTGTHELLHSTYDAFQALKDAYERARCIHRDVYPGNIVLYRCQDNDATGSYPARRGYLIDWDYACSRDQVPGEQIESSGYGPSLQWQFLSAAIGTRKKTSHDITDDMESILYVVIYCGILRLRCGIAQDKDVLVDFINEFFDTTAKLKGETTVGFNKHANKNDRSYTERIEWESQAMETWVNTVCDFLAPMEDTPDDRRGRWTPVALDEFWKTFLGGPHHLDRGDSVNNLAAEQLYYSRVAPAIALGTPSQPTTTIGTKRSAPSPAIGKKAKRLRKDTEDQMKTGLTSGLEELTTIVGLHPSRARKPMGKGVSNEALEHTATDTEPAGGKLMHATSSFPEAQASSSPTHDCT
ncbi:hypothetical protein C8Q73DRAFT_96093 [Cubamyces lactineus]|nr:hypothetical protein C8Q73DRAFT_96093 [Cubamyces lactineus]